MIGSSSGHPHSSVRYVGGRNRLSPLASSSRYRSATYRSTGDPSSLRPSSLTRWESSGFRSAGAVSNPAIVSMLARPPRPGQRAASTLGRRRELSANSPASPELVLNLTLTASSLPSLPGLGAQPWSCSDRPALIETRATRSRQSQRPNDAQVAAKSRFAAHESQSPKGRLCLLRSSWSTSTRRKSRAVSSPSDVYEQALKRIANRAAEPVLQWRRYTAGRKLTPWTVASIGCSSAAGKELMAASTMILGGRGRGISPDR